LRSNHREQWIDLDRNAIIKRYDRLATLIPLFDWVFCHPRDFRRTAVGEIDLSPGDRVLEIGCGTGRNFPHLSAAVGPTGRVFGVDISPRMLARARALCERHGFGNIELSECDAAEYLSPEPLDGVLFGLSYNTMPHHLAVLRHAWGLLRPGGRLVIMDSKLPAGLGGKLLRPFSIWLMKRTMLGNPDIHPWEDVARLTDQFQMREFVFGSHYICRGVKPHDAMAA
jgi:demethylmenaquinone methyltransferase/2-methoxy-6-polyprenyl-1,4-benzoquinol methylase